MKAQHGLYYVPKLSWRGRYISSHEEKPQTRWGDDGELASKVWNFCEEALKKALAT